MFHRQVDAAHRHRAAVEPAARAAHRDDRVDAAVQRRVAQHHGTAHGEADRRDAPVAELTGVPDGHVEIVDLLVAERGKAAGAAVPAGVERHHAGVLVEALHEPPGHRPLPGHGEPVHDDEREVTLAHRPCQHLLGQHLRTRLPGKGQVHGVDRDAVLGDQRNGHDDGIHSAPSW